MKSPKFPDVESALFQMLKDSGDLISELQKDPFNDKLPWDLIRKLGETGRLSRAVIRPHNIWDLTNDLERTALLKRAMGQ